MTLLKRISVSGYKSIRQMTLDLRPLNILIGGNGAGKSNLLSLFRLLSHLPDDTPSLVAREGGANALLHRGAKRTRQIEARMEYAQGFLLGAIFTYAAGDELYPVFSASKIEEVDTWLRSLASVPGMVEPSSDPFDRLTESFKLQFRSYHFHDASATAPVKQSADIDDNRFLHSDGANLAAFLYMLQKVHPPSYAAIRDTLRLAAPFFDDLVLLPSRLNPQRVLLRWRERDLETEYNAHQLSDGTLRFLCLCTLLLQPPELLPPLVLLDEPELGLHPYAIQLLAAMLRGLADKTQLIVSTQSVLLLDRLVPDKEDCADVVVVERQEEQSVFRRLDPAALALWLEEGPRRPALPAEPDRPRA